MEQQPNNPLHGITLKEILEHLVKRYQWEGLAERIHINCFKNEPSMNSSLKFLRKTPWARLELEALYLHSLGSGPTFARKTNVIKSSEPTI